MSTGTRPFWMPESTGDLQFLGFMPNGDQIWSNYAGRVEEDGTVIITATIFPWSWAKFRRVSKVVEIGKFPLGGGDQMDFSSAYKPGGPLDFEVRNADGIVTTPRYQRLYVFGR